VNKQYKSTYAPATLLGLIPLRPLVKLALIRNLASYKISILWLNWS